MRIQKIKFGVILILSLIVATWANSQPAIAKPNNKYASIVMDADTGHIISSSNPDKSLHPASLTKVMTLLLAFEALESGKSNLNDRVIISRKAASMVPSKLDLPPGASIKIKDAINILVTKSANDIAVALAEHIAGSESNFAKRMTNKAHSIGMNSTKFVNASGLHDPAQVTTARDMAKMARYVINVYPEYYRYFARHNFTYQGKTYRNHNRLMETYPGMDGMKTGYVAASGFNLIASAVQGKRRIIGVVFGGRSSQSRNSHMAELLDAGFKKARNVNITKARPPIPKRKPAYAQALASYGSANYAQSGQVVTRPPELKTQSSPQASTYQPRAASGTTLGTISQSELTAIEAKRLETGMLAASAHQYRNSPNSPTAHREKANIHQVSFGKPVAIKEGAPWSVQIGAFSSRAATDQAIQKTLQSLPSPYSQAQPLIAPMKTADGWLFRARLTGYTKEEALAACNYIRDCLPVAPAN